MSQFSLENEHILCYSNQDMMARMARMAFSDFVRRSLCPPGGDNILKFRFSSMIIVIG